MTKQKIRIVAVAAAVSLAGVAAAGIAVAGGSEEDEAPITGAALEKASAVALEQTGEGRVTGTEVGDEDAFYEVEVTLADGSQVDVHLDRNFTVVDERDDVEGGNDDQADEDADGAGDDGSEDEAPESADDED
jgi:hypothetical protein